MLLRFIARHSTLIMPICAIVGFIFPNLSNAVLVYLPQILFFLMFFTLLGIDQYALLKRIATSYVWVFALLQSAGMSLFLIVIAYALGVRGAEEEPGDLEGDVRAGGDQRRAQGVLHDGLRPAQALGTRSADVVGAQRVEHQVALQSAQR